MKKIISLMLVIAMMLSGMSVLAVSSTAAEVTHGYTLGDANDDGQLTMKDVLLTRKYLVGLVEAKEITLLAADITTDSEVNLKDVLMMRQVLLGLLDVEGNNTDSKYKVDTVTIADANISRYTIVISEDATTCMKFATEQLSRYINKACGIALTITDNEDEVEGRMIKFVFDNDDIYSLGKEGYKIDVDQDGEVTVYCGSMRGPLYAVDYLLEEFLGYRFLPAVDNPEVDDYVEYLYEAENVNLAAGFTETEVPVLSYRSASQKGVNSQNFWYLRDNSGDGSHYFGISDGANYGWGEGTLWIHAHSMYYQLGTPNNENPCFSKEENYQKIVEYNKELIDRRQAGGDLLGETWTMISCSPNDNTNFCQCSTCKAIYAIEGSLAGTLFRLSNRVAEKMEEYYPGIEVFTIAYWDAKNPPKITRPRENVTVTFCIGGCNNHSYDDVQSCIDNGGNPRLENTTLAGNKSNSSNVDDLDYLEKWAELTDNLMFWYYSANFCYHMAPSPNLFNIYNDFQYIASAGAKGIYCEGSNEGYYSFEGLRAYLVTKMMWNPYMSEEEYNECMNEALMIYYGDGWEYIREYVDMANYAGDLQGCWTNNFDRPFNMYNEEYFRDNYETMCGLFDSAIALASGKQLARLQKLRLHMDFLGLSATYERDYVNGTEESRATYAARYKNLYDMLYENNIRVSGLVPTNGSKGTAIGCENFPSSSSTIMNPMEWLWEGATGYWETKISA